MREEVVLAKTDQRDGLTRVMVEYVILFASIISILCHPIYLSPTTIALRTIVFPRGLPRHCRNQ
jgi:hypothetical protein